MQLFEHDFALLLKASCEGAVLIVLVLTMQWLCHRRLHPRWRYRLWLLVLVRLGLFWTIPAPTSLFNVLTPSIASPPIANAQVGSPGSRFGPAEPALGAEEVKAGKPRQQPHGWWGRLGSVLPWWLALWASGALALAGYVVVTQYRLARRIARHRPFIDSAVMNLLEDCKQQMGVRVPLTLVETAQVTSPSLFGFVRPRLLLPAGLTRHFSPGELRCVFLHELGHVKRRDIVTGWLAAGLQILHWFNPLVWVAFHRMRVDREMACDALALSYARREDEQRYGHTIIKLLESFGRPGWAPSLAGAVENQKQLKERIRMIAKFKRSNPGAALALALLAGLGLITLTDAQTSSSQLEKNLLGTWILVGHPGQVGDPPGAGGRYKLIADHHWSVTQADPQTGVTLFHHGGTYTLNGDTYAETIDYANENTRELVNRAFKFRIKIEGDKLALNGLDNPWKEVWKRENPDMPKARKVEPTSLQGKWRGSEAGKAGPCSLDIRGSSLEFHGADTNEWYKADISAYETSPKQLVVAITNCPAPQYVGATAYAIYQIENGKLTITGNEPGFPAAPTGFDAPGARKLVFQRE